MKMIKGKKVLVTGGAGFIGSNLCESLLENDNEVVCLDNFLTGHRKNIEPFLSNANFTLVEGDIRNLEDCKKAVAGVNIVLHQAALGSVPRSINDPLTTNDININGMLNMLVAARDEGVKRFVYAASSSTYGDHPKLPKEEDNVGRQLSPYAVTKYVNELYARNFSDLYGMETIGLRYFNVFGRRQDPDGAYAAAIPKFVKAFLAKESPTINGDGSITRDFTYIDNVVLANNLAATTTNPEAVNTVYNVACGEKVDLKTLVEKLRALLAQFDAEISNVEIKYGEERLGDIKESLASIDRAKRLLNYQPKYYLEEGLEKAINWYYANL